MAEPGVPVRRIVMVGLMASGKTTVGHALAAHLGWRFDDSDDSIEEATGLTARALRDGRGEPALHDAEAAHLLGALAGDRDVVVAAAAWVVEDERCRAALAADDVLVVWLRASPAVLAERFAHEAHRPPYGDDPAEFLADQASRRDPLYASVDPIVVDTDRHSTTEVVAAARAAVDRRLGR